MILILIENRQFCGRNNSDINSVKNCINCMIPHSKGGYDFIVNKIIEINKKKQK